MRIVLSSHGFQLEGNLLGLLSEKIWETKYGYGNHWQTRIGLRVLKGTR